MKLSAKDIANHTLNAETLHIAIQQVKVKGSATFESALSDGFVSDLYRGFIDGYERYLYQGPNMMLYQLDEKMT